MHKQLTTESRQVLALAELEARGLNHGYIGTEHILLAMMQEESGPVAAAFEALNLRAADIRGDVEKLVSRGQGVVADGAIPLTPRAKRVIEIAGEEARALQQEGVGPEHLLMGLVLEPNGVAGRVIRERGLTLKEIGERVYRIRLTQMRIVADVVRPVRASVPRKMKLREELLAHLTAIYEQELPGGDATAAMERATRRFGDPGTLGKEIDATLSRSERFRFAMERRFGWRAPESAARYMSRVALQAFVFIAAFYSLIGAGVVLTDGWTIKSRVAILAMIGQLAIVPIDVFVVGLFYFKMRDAMFGPVWARKSWAKVFSFGLLIGVDLAVSVLALNGVVSGGFTMTTGLLGRACAAGAFAAILCFVNACQRGRSEIAHTIWAYLELQNEAEAAPG